MIAVTALVVVGILLAGWSSNSKWALFGGMRSAAQVVCYEIPAGLAIMVPVLMAGTLSMQGIIRAQGGLALAVVRLPQPGRLRGLLHLLHRPAGRGQPHARSTSPRPSRELVAGYLSEYSGFRFALYFLVEWGNLWVMAAVAATLFLGGWQIPGVGPSVYAAARGSRRLPGPAWWGLQVALHGGLRGEDPRCSSTSSSGSAGRCRASASTR